jgi:serine protease inhibitor
MLKEILKPTWKNILLTILLLLLTGALLFMVSFVGISIPQGLTLLKILGLPFNLITLFSFSLPLIILLFILTIFWLYFLSCSLILLKRKLFMIEWNLKKIIILVVILIFGLIIYGFFNLGFGDIFIPRADDTGSTEEGMREIINANNQFALDVYREMSISEKGNLFYSPYSIFSALAMTYEGARGETAEEIKSVFYFPHEDILRPNFAAVYNSINRGNRHHELRTGNALWVQEDYPLLEDYLDRVESYYAGRAENMDFINEPEKSKRTINRYIEKQTKNRIQDVIESISPLTRLIITNAIYFKGDWEYKFDRKDTEPRDFFITPDNPIKVDMMYLKPENEKFNYLDTGLGGFFGKEDEWDFEFQMIELPYKGDDISMLVIVPKDNFSDFEANLTFERFEEYRSKMRNQELAGIYLPKFEFNTRYTLNEMLINLGMPSAFEEIRADFSGMTGERDLFIGEVIHQAYVAVDEKGTEAAATTVVTMMATSARMPPLFKADRPFIFIIQERETSNILFMGRVTDPTK